MNTQLNSGTTNHSSLDAVGDRLMGDLRSAVTEGDQVIKEMASATADEVKAARSKLASTVDGARTRLHDASVVVGQKARQAAEVSVEYAKENPWKTVGLIALAGLLAGALLKRRS